MDVQMIPLAAHETAMARENRVIRWLIACWMVSVVVLGAIIYSYATAEWDYTTETTTTETTTESADSGDYGNAIVGDGDITIGEGDPNNG